MDIAFIATFLLALPMTLLADAMARKTTQAINVPGILGRSPEGAIDAWIMDSQTAAGANTPAAASPGRSVASPSDTIIGNFNLSVFDDQHGWPLVTTISRAPARLTIDIIAEVGARQNVKRDVDDAYQKAISEALEFSDRDEAMAAWNLERPQTRRQWWAWFPAVGAWWIMTFALAAISIQFLRFASLWLRGRRMQREHRRRSEGKCTACGYDMTGLEFNEKCPECGAQVW